MLALAEARSGNMSIGLQVLAQVINAMPDPRYALWLPRFITTEAIAQTVDPETLNMVLTETLNKYEGGIVSNADERRALQDLVEPIEWVRHAHPDDAKFEGRCFSFYYQIGLPEQMFRHR